MAKLRSEDELETSFEINLKQIVNQTWLDYEIAFNFESERKLFESRTEDPTIGQFVFSVEPENRLKLMLDQIESFLNDESKNDMVFEPADPSFELIMRRAHGGYQVYLWVDCGNTKQLHYTWDARGIRLITSEDKIRAFVKELQEEASQILN